MDAGTRAADHYAKYMPPWLFHCREQILKVVRKETPILARMQDTVRTPLLDWYFAVTANVGTHTFYMVMLPVTFWFGDPLFGLDIVWVLALGVCLTGFLKDLLCLPRPMSPPLHRISMSGSAMLEYGMPSTHSCNAISVALVMAEKYPNSLPVYSLSAWLLATLISGRLYNGMHGFLDIIVGCVFGVASYELRRFIRERFDPMVATDNIWLTVLTILAISACPSPVDDCPCFDDSVAFSGVVLGLLWTIWVGISPYARFDMDRFTTGPKWLALVSAALRFLIGVGVIVVWRHYSKRLLLRVLPPVWRVLNKMGIRNPRRYFMPATQYSNVPGDLLTDNIPDSREEVNEMVTRIRHLRRSPSISVGPQSEADLYELRARESGETRTSSSPIDKENEIEEPRLHYDVEVAVRLIVYGGITPAAFIAAPVLFKVLNI